jgi:quinol monooxygenase YgiN
VAPDKAAEFSRVFHALQVSALQEQGCEQYELFQSVHDPARMVLLERWASQALLDQHMHAERTRNAAAIDALVALWATGTTPSIERFDV